LDDIDGEVSESRKMPHSVSLKNEVPTRWNSAQTMLQSLCCQQAIIDQSLKRIGNHGKILKAQEWRVLSQVNTFLSSLTDLTLQASGNTTELSLIPLVKAEILSLCQQPDNSDSGAQVDVQELADLKKRIKKNLESRMPITEEILIATLLDPSTRDLDILQCSDDQKVNLLIQAASGINQPDEIQTEENTVLDTPAGDNISNLTNLTKRQKLILKHSSHTSGSNRQAIEKEVRGYLSSTVDLNLTPYQFWACNTQKYPHLSWMARHYLTRSASSVPVESMFSICGLILNSKRVSLSPYTANAILFIHDNFSLYA
jgi:hypothetical protein